MTKIKTSKSRLKEKYQKETVPALMKQLQLKNALAVPRVTKVVLNVGAGQAVEDKSYLNKVLNDLTLISGQKAVVTQARQSVAGFKIRAGQKIGARVTLRGRRMYEFLDRLFNAVLPRMRDFHGLPLRGFDKKGNYSFGLREQTVFPEIDPSKVDRLRGLQVTIVTNAQSDPAGEALLRGLGMPLEKRGAQS